MRILFHGDSVTEWNRDYSDFWSLGDGYVKYVADTLKDAFGDELEFINRGVSGDRTCNILARINEDLIDLKPDIVTMLIGVNDTWRRYDCNDPTSAEQFRENYENILKKIKNETNAKIIILEPFLIYGLGRDEYRSDLNEKIDVTRQLAKQYADYYIPLDGILAAASVEYDDITTISADGVHPAEDGKKIIAWHLIQVLYELVAETLENKEQ